MILNVYEYGTKYRRSTIHYNYHLIISFHLPLCRRCCHTLSSYSIERVSCSSERRQRRQMYASYGASWRVSGDHSPLTTSRQPLRSFYTAERAAGARAFWQSLLVFFALALRLCFETLLVSAGALHLVSVGTHVSSLPALCSLCLSGCVYLPN